jgi:hypothetical protein
LLLQVAACFLPAVMKILLFKQLVYRLMMFAVLHGQAQH